MAEKIDGEEQSVFDVIPLHFNVPEHHLPLRDFIETASKTEAIIEAFNMELFEGKFRYEILVLPPELGSFKNRLAILAIAGAASVSFWNGMESDIGKAYIKGLTGHEPAYWAEQAGEATLEVIETDDEKKSKIIEKKCAAIVLTESTKGFLEKDFNELRNIGLSKEKFRDAYEARNDFYKACYQNNSIESVGFDESEKFPINRSDFPNYILALPLKVEEEKELEWVVGVAHIKVTSPNWERDDTKRNWKGRDGKGKEIYFTIEDEEFWGRVEIDQLHVHAVDNLKVQWAFVEEGNRRKYIRVLRVLEFNTDPISVPLANEELKTVLSKFEVPEDDQPELF